MAIIAIESFFDYDANWRAACILGYYRARGNHDVTILKPETPAPEEPDDDAE
jgi:hypothetical protein